MPGRRVVVTRSLACWLPPRLGGKKGEPRMQTTGLRIKRASCTGWCSFLLFPCVRHACMVPFPYSHAGAHGRWRGEGLHKHTHTHTHTQLTHVSLG